MIIMCMHLTIITDSLKLITSKLKQQYFSTICRNFQLISTAGNKMSIYLSSLNIFMYITMILKNLGAQHLTL